ncbi:MAG TPA: serine hydrolase domain-containing protein [Acidimicrobiales bacterium]|nr:serine hydrolase domain-containing protein [Acidimicrobiales bacterium]
MPDAPLPDGVDGWCHPRFAAVAAVLGRQLESGVHHGVAAAVRHRGQPVVDLWGGAFAEDTLAVSFSTTKGPVAACLHMVLERAGVPYDTPVADVWPEFAQAGKAGVTIRQVLCHEAGIPQIRGEIADVWAMADWDAMVATVEALPPLWEPGTANGYHALTWGWLAGELLRRIDGRPPATFLAEEVAGPLGLDGCFLGTPATEVGRLAPVAWNPIYLDMPPLEQLLPADSLTLRAVAPAGDIVEFVNSEVGRSSCVPAISGAFTARSLASVYALLERGGALGGDRLLSPETVAAATTVQNDRPDLVLFVPVHWRLGFMGVGLGGGLGGAGGDRATSAAFGHAGLGGSVAMADPRTELAVAVTLDRLELDLVGDDRAGAVIQAAMGAADAA